MQTRITPNTDTFHSLHGKKRLFLQRHTFKNTLWRCFIQDLSLDFHYYIDLFLHGRSSSFDNHWWYQERYQFRKSCPYLEFFWPAFSRIRTEYREIRSISPYSVRMRENTDQKNSKYWNFSRSDHELLLKNLHLSFEVSIKSTHEFEWYLQSVLLKWTGRTRKMIKRFSVLVVLYLKLLGQFQACLLFFVRKHFARTKTRHKQKPTSKTKLSKQKTTEATIFRAQKNF